MTIFYIVLYKLLLLYRSLNAQILVLQFFVKRKKKDRFDFALQFALIESMLITCNLNRKTVHGSERVERERKIYVTLEKSNKSMRIVCSMQVHIIAAHCSCVQICVCASQLYLAISLSVYDCVGDPLFTYATHRFIVCEKLRDVRIVLIFCTCIYV